MADNIKCFKILQDNVALEKISNEDFLKKIKENFKEYDVYPIALAFVLKKEELTEEVISISCRDDEALKNNTAIIEIQNNPDNMKIIKKILDDE